MAVLERFNNCGDTLKWWGKRLQFERESRSITQTQLARDLNGYMGRTIISNGSFSAIELAKDKVGTFQYLAYLSALDLSPRDAMKDFSDDRAARPSDLRRLRELEEDNETKDKKIQELERLLQSVKGRVHTPHQPSL